MLNDVNMKKEDLKCVVGQVAENQPAIIRFFDSVDSWSVASFMNEFLWLQDYVHPSKIIVLVNSDGGSIVQGMSVYSLIANCPIETTCIIEGIAASMGSIIWAAGKNLYMRDYSILMIHNPYICGRNEEDPNVKAMVEAFRNQIRTIYIKRFGLSEEEVTAIMDGDEGVDGTYMSADDAVSRGILPADHVIETPAAAKNQLKAEIDAAIETRKAVDYQKIVAKMSDNLDPAQVLSALEGVFAKKDNNIIHNNQATQTEMNKDFQTVASLLGLDAATAQLQSVSAKITELMNAHKQLEAVTAERESLKGKVLAHETTIQNLQANLDKANADLQAFQAAEAKRKADEIEGIVAGAIKAGKIVAEAKEKWVNFFNNSFELAQESLDAIPARVVVTEAIGGDADAQAKAAEEQKKKDEAMQEAKAKADAAVKAVLGEDVTFSKFD